MNTVRILNATLLNLQWDPEDAATCLDAEYLLGAGQISSWRME